MASCTSMRMFGELVDDFIKQYEEILNDDTLSEVESVDTQAQLDELYAYRRAVKANDRKYVEAQGFVNLQSSVEQEILQKTFKEVLGSTFSFTYGASKKRREGTLLSIKPTPDGVRVEFVEKGLPKSYNFPLSSNGRSQNSKSSSSYINIFGFRNFLDNYSINLSKNKEAELILGSRESKLKLGDEYKDKDYVHGSIDHMKTTLQKLHLLGGNKASQEELDTYLDLIDTMSPEFFNELELFIKEDGNNSEGVTRSRRIDMAVNSAPRAAGNQQSEASIYMEEVIHSMTASAMHADIPASRKLRRQLETLLDKARVQIKWEDFLPDPSKSIDAVAEEKYAKWLHQYIFNSKNADYEFIAKALAVPEVSKALKGLKIKEGKKNLRILERVNEFFAAILDIIRGNITLKQKSDNVHESLVNLAFQFAEINKKANRKSLDQGNYLTSVFDMLNTVDDSTAAKVKELSRKVFNESAREELKEMPDDMYGKVKYFARFIGLSIINPTYTKAMGVLASSYGLSPNSTIREVISGVFATDSAQKVAEFLTMQSGYIDKLRNNQIDLVRKNVLSEFEDPKQITKELEEALTDILASADLASLFGKSSSAKIGNIRKTVYDNKTLRKLLTDDATLDRLIKDTKRALKELDNVHYNWHSNQATGLGIYMATNRGTPEQNLNAHNIARGIHSSHKKKVNKEVEAAIDELATLVAIKNTDKSQRDAVAQLMKEQPKGVQHVADVVEGFKKNSDETVFKGRKTNKIKGYTREVYDDTIVMEVAPAEDRAKMEAQGFTYRASLAPRAGDIRNKPMALYVTDSLSRPDRLRGGVRLNQITSKGTTITDAAYKDGKGFSNNLIRERAQRDINKIQRDALARAKKMEKGEYDFTNTVFGITAVLNDDGKVTDYRYMMDKATKKELLGQDTRISEVMARSFGTILDKDLSSQHNSKMLDAITKDMVENWTEGTRGNDGMTEYTLIGPKASDPEMRKLYYMMPREFQEFVQRRADNTLAVRTDLLYLYFGYSNLSITDFPGLKKVTPQVLIKVINFAEMMWMEMIKVVKSNILLKMPTILLSNIFSNFLYAVMRGYDPITVAKKYIHSYRDISEYNRNTKKVQELVNEKRKVSTALERDALPEKRKKELSRQLKNLEGQIVSVKDRLTRSPIDELVQLGLDQNVEDVTNDTENDSNRITSYIDDKLEVAPEIVRNGLDILFLTKRTTFYKVTNEFLETSDLVARDIQNRLEKKNEQSQADGKRMLPDWWLEKQEEGYRAKQRLTGEERKLFLEEAKKERQYDLVEDFINYTKPSSRFEEYLNKVGILMFTKYVKRIQRIILKTGSRGPIKALVGSLGFAYLGGLPSIHEQSFLVKDWYGDSIGPGNVFPVYSPTEHFMNFVTPSLLKESTYDFGL